MVSRTASLQIWGLRRGGDGSIAEVEEDGIEAQVLEIKSSTIGNTYIVCPAPSLRRDLGLRLRYLNLIVKSLGGAFSFEAVICDDKYAVRRFRASNYQVGPKARPPGIAPC